MSSSKAIKEVVLAKKYTFAFILLASCFMWWGLANNLTDPLVKVFKAVFGELTTFQASLMQFAFYFGYFCMAIPGAMIARKYSYKVGVLVGLGFYIAGCLLLYPSTLLQEFIFFCISYYILACGLGILETNANPYVLSLGSKKTATRRLNLAQSFNPIGSVGGIFLCQIMVMSQMPLDGAGNIVVAASEISEVLDIVITPYLGIAVVLVIVWLLIAFAKMPTVKDTVQSTGMLKTLVGLLKRTNYRFAVTALFFYVGAQIAVWTYTNFYIPEQLNVTPEETLQYHMMALVLFGVFRWIFTLLMKRIKAHTLLLWAASTAAVCSLCVIFVGGMAGVISLIAISACMSLMFPTIFGMGCKGLSDDEVKVGSSGLIMAILGGALITPLQGAMIDWTSASKSYVIPLICFVVVGAYAAYSRRTAS